MSTTIECPSGLSLVIRGLQARELKIFQDRALIKSGLFLDRILAACVESVTESGPYDFEALPNWDQVLQGDKYFTLLRIRAESFGDDFSFPVKCSGCDEKYQWDLKLSDLPLKRLAPADAQAFKTGTPLVAKIPSSGASIKFRLAVGKDEKMAAKAKTEQNAILAMLALRISEIENVEAKDIKGYLETLSLGDFFAMLKEMGNRDCGVETSIDVACPSCGNEQPVELPIGAGFWNPGRG